MCQVELNEMDVRMYNRFLSKYMCKMSMHHDGVYFSESVLVWRMKGKQTQWVILIWSDSDDPRPKGPSLPH